MEDKVNTKDKVVVGILRTSVIGLQAGWILTGLGLVGVGLVIVSTQVGHAAMELSGKKVS
jgi:hypothetical protein